jgi:predicted O-linked N-acetylglucosamine transferase (SPINDLY family)
MKKESILNSAIEAHNLGDYEKGELLYRKFLRTNPASHAANNNLGLLLMASNRAKDAAVLFEKIARMCPEDKYALINLGNCYIQQKLHNQALECYQQSIKSFPAFELAWNNYANCLKDMGRYEDSLHAYEKTIELKPEYAEAHYNLGVALHELKQYQASVQSFEKAIAINPDYADAYYNCGLSLQALEQNLNAIESYSKAISIKPDFAEAYNNLGNLLRDFGQFEKAFASYRRALAIKPDYTDAHSTLLFALNYAKNHPHSHYVEEACKYGQVVAKMASTRFSEWQCVAPPERLRVGIASGDLRNHPVGYFLEGLLSNIDQSRIELIAYPTNPKEDELTARIRPSFSGWKSLVGKSDSEAAHLIHDDGVHILLDLSGHTAYNRLPVFAWKPAPIQAMWLGYFATSGVREMDYIMGDRWLLPVGEEDHFVEKGWCLPSTISCMTPPKENITVDALPALSNRWITFGSLNNLSKINDRVVACWARILREIPNSRLYLNTERLADKTIRKNEIEKYGAFGIDEDRLIFEATVGRSAALNSYNKIDIALDTFPYPGGTTSFEALWMGVPVLTMRGNDFLSHLGESVMNNAGLPDWIAEDEGDYVTKAIALAGNLDDLENLRSNLRTNVLASPLYDIPLFARNFEAALWGMWGARERSRLEC